MFRANRAKFVDLYIEYTQTHLFLYRYINLMIACGFFKMALAKRSYFTNIFYLPQNHIFYKK